LYNSTFHTGTSHTYTHTHKYTDITMCIYDSLTKPLYITQANISITTVYVVFHNADC